MKASELHENLKCPICIEFVEEPIECQECFNILNQVQSTIIIISLLGNKSSKIEYFVIFLHA